VSAELDIYNAVMNCLKGDSALRSFVKGFYEGRREHIAGAQFPCVMLSVEGIDPISRRHDNERRAMRFVVGIYVNKWDIREMYSSERNGILHAYNLLDHALLSGAIQHPPFGIGNHAISTVAIGQAVFPTVIVNEYPYFGIEMRFSIEYVVLNSER